MKKIMKEILSYCRSRGMYVLPSGEKIVVPLVYKGWEFSLTLAPVRKGVVVTLDTALIFDCDPEFQSRLNSIVLEYEGFCVSLVDEDGEPEIVLQKNVRKGPCYLPRIMRSAGTMVKTLKLVADFKVKPEED